MALVNLVCECSWVEAADALDLPRSSGIGRTNWVMGILNTSKRSAAFGAALYRVSHDLSGREERTDYAELRRELQGFTKETREA